jgi:hypothetical protein
MKEEVSIEEKVKAVFEWAGFKEVCLGSTSKIWRNPDMGTVYLYTTRKYEIPMPDDIEFLGYMDKYVESKLKKDGWNINIRESEINVLVWIIKEETLVRGQHKEKAIALINAIYELIKNDGAYPLIACNKKLLTKYSKKEQKEFHEFSLKFLKIAYPEVK